MFALDLRTTRSLEILPADVYIINDEKELTVIWGLRSSLAQSDIYVVR